MKNIFSAIILSVLLTPSLCQSTTQGIYLSANNFDCNKISFAPVEGKRYKMFLHEVFYKPIVKIASGDSSYTFNKAAVWGYRDRDNIVYRFYKKHVYSLLNPGEVILLYSRTYLGGYRNSQTVVSYYFSTDANAPVELLTKGNLKNSFSADTAFHDLLDIHFRNDIELIGYDSFYKMYKVNHVLQLAQQSLSKKTIQ